MIDQSRIASGYDLELLMSERYLKYFLLTSFETGSMPWYVRDVDPATGNVSHIMIHPPRELELNRLYEPRPDFVPHPFQDQIPTVFTDLQDACAVELLPDDQDADIRVTMIISVIATLGSSPTPIILTQQDMTLDARFFVMTDTGADGSQQNARFRLETVDVHGPFVDKARALDVIRAAVDREIPLSVIGNGGAIQEIATRKFLAADADDAPTCLALYVNLKLRNGPQPDAFVGSRGDLSLARNFLPRDHEMAFGFNAELYPRLANDIFQRMARPRATGGFSYPLNPDDPGMGHVNSVGVFAQGDNLFDPGVSDDDTEFPNILVIRVRGEYSIDSFFEPDFTMTIRLIPSFSNGVLTFATDFDLNVPLTGWLIVGTALLSFLSLTLAIPSTLAALALRAIVEKIGEDQAVPIIEEQMGDASLFDTLPSNLPVEKRRWDPAYFTDHQIVALVQDVAINNRGMAFAGYDLRVGKQPRALENAVIRSEVRDANGDLSGLLYRINDWNDTLEGDLDLVFPATDRMDFVDMLAPQPDGIESHRLHLTIDQAVARIQAKRLIERIVYRPYKVHEKGHQIYQLLVLSNIEAEEIRSRAKALLRNELEQQHGQEYDQQAHEELLAELGREPTPQEIQARHNQLVQAAVDAGADKRYRLERERFLKFDLEPFELAELEYRKLLKLEFEGLQIVKVRASAGGAVYYRDRPDADKGDNLLQLPHYISEPIVRL